MPSDLAHPSAAGISLQLVPGIPALFGKRIRAEGGVSPSPSVAPVRLVEPATDAEALARSLIECGSSVIMTIAPDGLPSLAFRFAPMPPSPSATSIAATIRNRFLSDLRFRRDLFGHLLVEGAVFQRFAERQPERIRLEDAPT